MNYYKIMVNNQIVGVSTSINCLRFQVKHQMLECTDDTHAEYMEYANHLYHAQWMLPIQTNTYPYIIADILTIEEQEYNILAPAVANEPITVEVDEPTPIIIPDNPIDEITLEFVRTSKINEMSRICRQTIEAGFDLELRGETRHFSLSTQDQLNLISLSTMAQTQSIIPYHADGEECEFYTADEINTIIAQAMALKNYNIAYYNSLKAYINELETIEEIAAIQYGTSIPEEYKSDVLKVLEY